MIGTGDGKTHPTEVRKTDTVINDDGQEFTGLTRVNGGACVTDGDSGGAVYLTQSSSGNGPYGVGIISGTGPRADGMCFTAYMPLSTLAQHYGGSIEAYGQ